MEHYHRYFVQYMLKHGITTVENGLRFSNHASGGQIRNAVEFKTMIIQINREISQQFFKLVFATDELINRQMVVWLNTKSDDIAKHQIGFSAIELEYFNAMFQEILNSLQFKLTFIVCINITSTLTKPYTRNAGQDVLMKFIEGGYFVRQDENVHLGQRTILEFSSYLKTRFPQLLCNLCSELVFYGHTCASCEKHFHFYCILKAQNRSFCPACQEEWDITIPDFSSNETEYIENDKDNESQDSEMDTENNDASAIDQAVDSDNESDSDVPAPTRRKVRRR